MIFSIEEARADLTGSLGYSFDLESSLEQAGKNSGLASSAHAFINTSIKCYLAGLDIPGDELAKKAINWLQAAISNKEVPKRYFPEGTEAARLYDMSLAKWLIGEKDTVVLQESIRRSENYFSGSAGRDPVSMKLTLIEYLDAGRCELIRTHANAVWKNAKKLPYEVVKILDICDGNWPTEEIHPEVISLLKRMSKDWLARGHYDYFAKWVKVGSSRMSSNIPAPDLLRQALKSI